MQIICDVNGTWVLGYSILIAGIWQKDKHLNNGGYRLRLFKKGKIKNALNLKGVWKPRFFFFLLAACICPCGWASVLWRDNPANALKDIEPGLQWSVTYFPPWILSSPGNGWFTRTIISLGQRIFRSRQIRARDTSQWRMPSHLPCETPFPCSLWIVQVPR